MTLNWQSAKTAAKVKATVLQGKKVLFVCSGNHTNVPAFIQEQKEGLEKSGFQVDYFLIRGKGIAGYLQNYKALLTTINRKNYDLVHAHFGLSGLFANLQRKVPVVTTFHGCDLNKKSNRIFSKLAARLSKKSIVVSNDMATYLPGAVSKEVIPCGVDMSLFTPAGKEQARQALSNLGKKTFNERIHYVLFSSSFDRDVKNPQLAFDAMALLGKSYELIELKNLNRKEVVLMMNAADAVLMTSRTEGSPQFIKEAMACNRPVVTTPVGDVAEIIGDTKGCFIVPPDAGQLATALRKAVAFDQTTGRQTIGARYDNDALLTRVIALYTNL